MTERLDGKAATEEGSKAEAERAVMALLDRLTSIVDQQLKGHHLHKVTLNAVTVIRANLPLVYTIEDHKRELVELSRECVKLLRLHPAMSPMQFSDSTAQIVLTFLRHLTGNHKVIDARGHTTDVNSTLGILNEQMRNIHSELMEQIREFQSIYSTEHAIREARAALAEVQEAALSAREAASGAQEAESHARQAAGLAGGTELANHYAAHAKSERRWNIGWTVGLVILVVIAVVMAWFLVRSSSLETLSSREVGRLALAVPLLLLAAYASRQAKFHRDASSKSAVIAVQLRTVLAFGDSLDEGRRSDLYYAFGMTLFLDVDRPKGPDAAFGLGSEVLEALKVWGSRPDTGSK